MNKNEMDRRTAISLLGAISCAPGLVVQSSCVSKSIHSPLNGFNQKTLQYLEASFSLTVHEGERFSEVKQVVKNTQASNKTKILQLNEMIKYDYTNDKTINLFDWKISQTEASLFAMANTQ